MTGHRITTDAAHDLLVLADPVPAPPTFDAVGIAHVVRHASSHTSPAVVHLHPDGSRRRRVVLLTGGVAVAAAVTSVAVATLAHGGDDRPHATVAITAPSIASRAPSADVQTTTPTTPTAPTTAQTAPVTDPVLFLHTAASVSASSLSTAPRPDQFLYVHEDNGYQAWMSIDGTHDGLIVPSGTTDRIVTPGCRNGVTTETGDGSTVTTPCTPDPAYRPDIPSDPTALQQWLVAQGGGPSTNSVAKQILTTLEFDYLTPATRGALYTVLAGYDGLTVVDVPSAPEAVGVTWSYGGGSVTLVFGRSDHAYRGVLTHDGGSVDGSTSIVVDAVGQTG